MFWIFITFFVFISLFILLGPYRFAMNWDNCSETSTRSLSLISQYDIIGIQWIKKNETSTFLGLFMSKSLMKFKKTKTSEPVEKLSSGTKKTSDKWRSLWHQMIIGKDLIGVLISIFSRLIQIITIDRIRVSGDVGLSNPALTGLSYGIGQFITPFQNEKINISIIPNFYVNTLQGQAAVDIRFIMARLLFFVIYSAAHLGLRYRKSKAKLRGTS